MKTPAHWQNKNVVSSLLTPLGLFYGALTALRLKLKKGFKASVPVICVGNITAGGVGKTPVSIALAQILQSQGKNPFFISRGYGGKLNIRPAFQREFVYKEKQRNAVIETVIKGFPLNVMYWVEDENGNYELLDGQQRTISICQYVNGDFSLNSRAFHNLTETEKNQILDYPLMIYICNGNDKEKLD